MKRKINVIDIIIYVILAVLSITTLYPFVNMLAISLSPMSEVAKSTFMILPKKITFDAYEYVIKYSELFGAYKITLFITVIGTLINIALTLLGAYVLSNKQVPGRNFMNKMLVFTMLFSGGTIPTYMVVRQLGLVNSVWSLILPQAINAYWLILMRNFMSSIPSSLSEAARIDGCSEYGILFRVILPLSLPITATLVLFYGVYRWNSYQDALLYITRSELRPLQVVIRAMYEEGSKRLDDTNPLPPSNTLRAAAVMLSSLPILCVYPFVQKYFVQGMMVGAVKG